MVRLPPALDRTAPVDYPVCRRGVAPAGVDQGCSRTTGAAAGAGSAFCSAGQWVTVTVRATLQARCQRLEFPRWDILPCLDPPLERGDPRHRGSLHWPRFLFRLGSKQSTSRGVWRVRRSETSAGFEETHAFPWHGSLKRRVKDLA